MSLMPYGFLFDLADLLLVVDTRALKWKTSFTISQEYLVCI